MRRIVAASLGIATLVAAILVAQAAITPVGLPVEEADGLPIPTVSEALAIRERADETQPVAVIGWLSYGFAHSCPAPMGVDGGFRDISPIELYCRRGEDVLTELREAAAVVRVEELPEGRSVSQRIRPLTGPHLDPAVVGHVIDGAIWPPGGETWVPQPIVAVGHFRDHRAAQCGPEDVAFCLGVFVIDHVAILRGEQLGAARQPIAGLGPPVRTPEAVEERVRQELGEDVTILSTAAYRGADLLSVEDRAPRVPDREAVWLLRVIDRGADGTGAPRLVSLVVDDGDLTSDGRASTATPSRAGV